MSCAELIAELIAMQAIGNNWFQGAVVSLLHCVSIRNMAVVCLLSKAKSTVRTGTTDLEMVVSVLQQRQHLVILIRWQAWFLS